MKPPFNMKKPVIRLLLVWTLRLIAIHSICFGLSLIIFPCSVLEFFGFTITQKFFATQGGVFHLIISYAYIVASMKIDQSKDLIILSCFTKFSATLFLFSYFIFGSQIPLILLSGFLDGLMGLAILYFYMLYMDRPDNR